MKFCIDSSIFKRYSGLNLGLVLARNLDNRGDAEAIDPLIRDVEAEIRALFQTETLSTLPKIQSWRQAYSAFGAKPKKYKSSVESLYRTVLKGGGLHRINPIVDIYNTVSLKHMLPVGGDDLAGVSGGIELRFARGDEKFIPLHAEIPETVKTGEVVYADDRQILCRRWNWRECDATKMSPQTRDCLLVVEGLSPVTAEEIDEAAGELAGMIENLCGGDVNGHRLDESHSELLFDYP